MKQPTLSQVAAALHERLTHREAQQPQSYYYAGAMVVGRRIHAWTHSYHPATKLTKAEAIHALNTFA